MISDWIQGYHGCRIGGHNRETKSHSISTARYIRALVQGRALRHQGRASRVKVSFRVWGKLPNRTMLPRLNATADFEDVGGGGVFKSCISNATISLRLPCAAPRTCFPHQRTVSRSAWQIPCTCCLLSRVGVSRIFNGGISSASSQVRLRLERVKTRQAPETLSRLASFQFPPLLGYAVFATAPTRVCASRPFLSSQLCVRPFRVACGHTEAIIHLQPGATPASLTFLAKLESPDD